MSVNPAPTADDLTYCAVHPDKETGLRCNKCGRLMCAECAVQTPVGYRCKQCIRQHEDKFFTATPNDTLIVIAVCAGLALVGGVILGAIGFGLFLALILGVPAGGIVSEAALRAVKRRRSRYSGEIGAVAVVFGGILGAIGQVYFTWNSRLNEVLSGLSPEQIEAVRASGQLPTLSLDFVLRMAFSDIGLLLFVGIVAFVVYSRFKMKM
jgi:MFS family permease